MNRLHFKDAPCNRDVISLFSGAMGLDFGLEQAGLKVVLGQDIDPACVATIRANGHRALGGDIRDIAPADLLAQAGMAQGEPFLLCGGPPCQPFSTAGKRLGIHDPRGGLFMDFIRMIDYIRPRFFIMENVKGLMSASLNHASPADRDPNDPEQQRGAVLDVILSEFHKLGYKTVYGILDAVNYGVPQFRERFVLIGSRDHEEVFLPLPTHFQTHQDAAYRWRTLRDAIGDLERDCGECASFSAERLEFLRLVPEGGNWRDLPEDVQEEAMGGAYRSGGGKVGFFRRLSYRQPSPTLVTSPVQKATMMCHPTMDRPLSIREYARIQQFPDHWVFQGSGAEQYRQIGNAVPVGLARALGQAVCSVADRTSSIQTKRFRGTDIHQKLKQALELGGSSSKTGTPAKTSNIHAYLGGTIMEGILTNLDRTAKSGTVDTRNDSIGVLTIYFKEQELTDAVQTGCSVQFDVVTSKAGKPYAKFLAVTDRNQALFNTEDRAQWYTWGEEEEKDFVAHIVPKLGIDLRINPEKAARPHAIDLFDYTHDRYADLKTQKTPFFTAGKYLYHGKPYDPTYTVTFNKKDYENYLSTHPDCDIYFWVCWAQLTYQDKHVEPLRGVWRAPFAKLAEKIQAGEVALHAYQHRVNDDHNAKESYLFQLDDPAVFEQLV